MGFLESRDRLQGECTVYEGAWSVFFFLNNLQENPHVRDAPFLDYYDVDLSSLIR